MEQRLLLVVSGPWQKISNKYRVKLNGKSEYCPIDLERCPWSVISCPWHKNQQ